MNLSRCVCQKTRNLDLIRQISSSSIRYEASSKATQPQIKEEKYDFEDLKVIERPERRKPPIPPFMKNVFVSVFNKELLAFPEILNKDEMQDLDNRINILDNIFNNKETTEKEKLLSLKQTSLYGAPISVTDGGLSMNITERLRYLETLSSNTKLSKSLSDHWVGTTSLVKGLEKEKFNQISYELLKGDIPMSFCVREKYSSNVNQPDLRSCATLLGDDVWYIEGEKYCRNSDGYIVTLCTVEEMRLKPFLVHPKARGVTAKGDYVKFIETPVTPLNLTEDQINGILSISRVDTACIAYSLLRNLIKAVSKHVRGKFVGGEPLADLPLLRCRIADALIHSYAAESMCFFTAGLVDGYESPDYDLESALCRLYTIEHCQSAMMGLLDALGVDGLHSEWQAYLHSMRFLAVQDDLQDNLHIYSALLGLRHAGTQMADEVKQLRNPLFHPAFIMKKMFANRHQEADKPKLTLHLEENLHPSLKHAAQSLEYSVLRMKYACELILSRHGAEVSQKHTDLKRLSLAACDVFAMTAVLARASRAYCIGVRNSDMDMKLAGTIVEMKRKSVSKLIKHIEDGEYLNLDFFKLDFGKKVLDTCSIPVQPAIERVYW